MSYLSRIIAVCVAALSFAGLGAYAAEDASAPACFVVQHYYFPLEGKEDEALETRIRGNEVRAALGLATSRLMVVKSSARGHPAKGPMEPGDASYLMSETVFTDAAAAKHADEVLAASQDYLAVRQSMAPLLAHFELATRTVIGGDCAP